MNEQQAAPEERRDERSYATDFVVDRTPAEVYRAVLDVPAWWTGQHEGAWTSVGEEFDYRHPPQHYSRQRVMELDPDRLVVWQVVDSALTFVSDPQEWTGSLIRFEIEPAEPGTRLRFTHVGLVPGVACYAACSAGWTHYLHGSLRALVTTGAGLPDPW